MAQDPGFHYMDASRESKKPREVLLETANPSDTVARNDRAVALFRTGHSRDAVKLLHEINLDDPASLPPALNLGRYLLLTGHEEALRALYGAIAANTKIPADDIYRTADTIWKENRPEEAKGLMDALFQTKRSVTPSAVWLGNEALSRDDRVTAMRYYTAALEAKPGDPAALFGSGYILYGERRWPDAAGSFKKALQGGSKEPFLCFFLTDSLRKEDHLSEALQSARECPADLMDWRTVELMGDMMLLEDYRADLSPLKRYLRTRRSEFPATSGFFSRLAISAGHASSLENRWDYLMQHWYGETYPEFPPEMMQEFERQY